MFADGAHFHTSGVTQTYIEKAPPEFIKKDQEKVYGGVRDKLTEQQATVMLICKGLLSCFQHFTLTIARWTTKRLLFRYQFYEDAKSTKTTVV